MAVSYKKLWKLLIDKDMKKKDLCAKAGISPASVTKMGRNGHVTTEILLKICTALDCGVEDIMEIVPDSSENTCSSPLYGTAKSIAQESISRRSATERWFMMWWTATKLCWKR